MMIPRGPNSVRVVGIDGGATRTRFVLSDARGGVLGRRIGEGSLLGAGEDDSVLERLRKEVETLVRESGEELPVDALCAGLAGAGQSETRDRMAERLRSVGLARRVAVVPDAEVAFADAFGAGPGILLIAGTGSIALGRDRDGHMHRVGGWGALLGDEGSGYRIGLDGLQAALRGAEGRGPNTGLTETVFDATGSASPDDLLHWSRRSTKARVASLAPQVVSAADEGDEVAATIVESALVGLTGHLEALERMVGPPLPPVALVGGLVQGSGPLRPRLAERLEEEGYELLHQPVDGARGAARLALTL